MEVVSATVNYQVQGLLHSVTLSTLAADPAAQTQTQTQNQTGQAQ